MWVLFNLLKLITKGVQMKFKKIIAPIGSAVALLSSATVAFAAGAGGGAGVAVPVRLVGSITPGPGFAASPQGLIEFILRLVLAIGALLVFGFLIAGGIQWITSGGDKGKTESARNTITAAVIGLLILASSWAILNLVLGFLGLTSLEGVINNVGTI